MPDDRSAHTVLAAVKAGDASDVVLRMAQWLAERELRAPRVVSLVDGSGADTIAAAAREAEAGIVVVGKGTHGRLSHLVHGDQVMDLVRRTGSPVLAVPPNSVVPVERAMVALDFGLASIRAAATAHELLAGGGRLSLVHVATSDRAASIRSQWWLRSVERRTHEMLRDFAAALPRRAGVAIETEQIHGDVADALVAYARSRGMQLLACGWHEHASLGRFLTESTTAKLLHRADCAVLVARETGRGARDDAEGGR
jgi:nucleotide-binding universal stress UspA family protein